MEGVVIALLFQVDLLNWVVGLPSIFGWLTDRLNI